MANTKLKPLYLYDIFHRTDSAHRVSAPELVEQLSQMGIEAERKGIYRDIDALVEYGLDIRKTSTGYYLEEREFRPAEVMLLLSAVQAANFITDKRTQALSEKLLTLLSAAQAEELRRQAGLCTRKCGSDEVLKTIESLSTAIAERRQVTFSYYKRDINKRSVVQRSGQRYRVSPYAMIWLSDHYYLVCNVEGKDALTHFRLDRMQNVRPDNTPWRHFSEVSEYHAVFDGADYARKSPGMFGGAAEPVSLRCSDKLVGEVLDRFGEDIPIARDGEEHFRCTVRAAGGEGFLNWAGQFGAMVEILAPVELRERMLGRLQAALKCYAGQPAQE